MNAADYRSRAAAFRAAAEEARVKGDCMGFPFAVSVMQSIAADYERAAASMDTAAWLADRIEGARTSEGLGHEGVAHAAASAGR